MINRVHKYRKNRYEVTNANDYCRLHTYLGDACIIASVLSQHNLYSKSDIRVWDNVHSKVVAIYKNGKLLKKS